MSGQAVAALLRTRRTLLADVGLGAAERTLRQYAHVIPGMQAAAAALIAGLVRDQSAAERDVS